MNHDIHDIVIIGGGVIGASIARELSKYQKNVLVLEANKRVAMETSAANSGLVHGGFDPVPGKLNAKLNILGKKRYEDWIRELTFPYIRINSTVVAFNDEEMQEIQKLYHRGLENGLDPSELEMITPEELQSREPNVSKEIIGALVCNSSIALDTVELTKALMDDAIKNNITLKLETKVTDIDYTNEIFSIHTEDGRVYKSKVVINAAGHYADVLAEKAGYPDFHLVVRRGQYRILEQSEGHIVNSVVFMVPTIHGKGVIVAPMLDGRILVGPTAEDNLSKCEARLITMDNYDSIGEIGQKLIPNLKIDRTMMVYAGSRPIEPTTDDFWIKSAHENPYWINVAGMKSPAISSAPAIADMVIEMIKPLFDKFLLKTTW